MAGKEPKAGQPHRAGDTSPTPCAEVRERLADADSIGLREPAQAAIGGKLGAVEVGVEGEAGRAKGIDWDTRHLLGGRCRSFQPTPHPEMPRPLSPPPFCKNARQPQPRGAGSAPRASGGPAPGDQCSRMILRQPQARLCAMMLSLWA